MMSIWFGITKAYIPFFLRSSNCFVNFAGIGMIAYNKSSFLRYLEEALAESYSQLRVNGLCGLPTGIKFPIKEGYVTIQAVAAAGALGSIVIGGVTYNVFHDGE